MHALSGSAAAPSQAHLHDLPARNVWVPPGQVLRPGLHVALLYAHRHVEALWQVEPVQQESVSAQALSLGGSLEPDNGQTRLANLMLQHSLRACHVQLQRQAGCSCVASGCWLASACHTRECPSGSCLRLTQGGSPATDLSG